MFKVEGLPDGWAVKEVHIDPDQYNNYVGDDGCLYWQAKIKMEKIQPRRVYFDEITDGTQNIDEDFYIKCKWWREVKEIDIPLTNSEPNVKMCVIQGDCDDQKLELSVKELRNVRSLIKDFENLGWFINPERALLLQKITEFIKDK